jgi:hypothetical protein
VASRQAGNGGNSTEVQRRTRRSSETKVKGLSQQSNLQGINLHVDARRRVASVHGGVRTKDGFWVSGTQGQELGVSARNSAMRNFGIFHSGSHVVSL